MVKPTKHKFTLLKQVIEIIPPYLEGENPKASANIQIGTFKISGLSPVPAPNIILLNLELDLNGVLKVTATEKATGLSKTVIMETGRKAATGNNQTSNGAANDLSSYYSEMEDASYDDIDEKETLLSQARLLRRRAEKLLSGDINSEDARELRDLLDKLREAITAGEEGIIDECNTSLEYLLFYLEG